MDRLLLLTLVAFVVCFAGVYYVNSTSASDQFEFVPPYYFETGEVFAIINSFLFVFIFSLLFFGYGAPIAMAVEGLKYGSLYSLKALPEFDLLFVVPQALACYSAVLLGKSALDDFGGKGSLFEAWRPAFKYFVVSAVLLGALLVVRGFF